MVVRRLAPRIYEGGGKSSAHWYRGETVINISVFCRKFVLPQSRLTACQPPHKCGGRGRLRRRGTSYQRDELMFAVMSLTLSWVTLSLALMAVSTRRMA